MEEPTSDTPAWICPCDRLFASPEARKVHVGAYGCSELLADQADETGEAPARHRRSVERRPFVPRHVDRDHWPEVRQIVLDRNRARDTREMIAGQIAPYVGDRPPGRTSVGEWIEKLEREEADDSRSQ